MAPIRPAAAWKMTRQLLLIVMRLEREWVSGFRVRRCGWRMGTRR